MNSLSWKPEKTTIATELRFIVNTLCDGKFEEKKTEKMWFNEIMFLEEEKQFICVFKIKSI